MRLIKTGRSDSYGSAARVAAVRTAVSLMPEMATSTSWQSVLARSVAALYASSGKRCHRGQPPGCGSARAPPTT